MTLFICFYGKKTFYKGWSQKIEDIHRFQLCAYWILCVKKIVCVSFFLDAPPSYQHGNNPFDQCYGVGKHLQYIQCINTVDGRNPAPVDMANILVSYEFYISQLVAGFLPSTVSNCCLDSFHHPQITGDTPLKFNIAPKNRQSQKGNSSSKHHFSGAKR